jgi:perosamine synthetase
VQRIQWWSRKLNPELGTRLGQAIEAGQLSYGRVGHELESKFARALDVPFVTLTSSGSAALLVLYRILGLGPESEVIIPTRTFQATANAAAFLRASLVTADVDDRGLLNTDHARAAFSPRTKVIVPVHLNGRACETESIVALAKSRGAFVVEDAAQAMFSRGKAGFCGTGTDAGIFSLGVTKFLTSGQGGLIVTRDEALHREVRKYLLQAVAMEPREHYPAFGFNFRLADLLSTVALQQFEQRDELRDKYLDLYHRYSKALRGHSHLRLIETKVEAGEIPIWIEAMSPRRDELVRHLSENGIEARSFAPSLHDCAYLEARRPAGFEDNAKRFSDDGLILPCGPELSTRDFERVLSAIDSFR